MIAIVEEICDDAHVQWSPLEMTKQDQNPQMSTMTLRGVKLNLGQK